MKSSSPYPCIAAEGFPLSAAKPRPVWQGNIYNLSMTIMDAKTAYNYVLENAGATFPKRDAVDTRVIKTVKTRKLFM